MSGWPCVCGARLSKGLESTIQCGILVSRRVWQQGLVTLTEQCGRGCVAWRGKGLYKGEGLRRLLKKMEGGGSLITFPINLYCLSLCSVHAWLTLTYEEGKTEEKCVLSLCIITVLSLCIITVLSFCIIIFFYHLVLSVYTVRKENKRKRRSRILDTAGKMYGSRSVLEE